ncbi:MAG: ribosomal protein S18-alanine N-acetyltransferase [Polyangiales bacterium]
MTSKALVIDRMTAHDVPEVLAIELDSPEGSSWDEPMVRSELERSWAYLWVARRGAAPGTRSPTLAFVATWLVQDELHVLNVATRRDVRRQGLARKLLDHALRFACEKGVRLVLLEVRRSNAAAIGLYRELGFIAMGVRAKYYSDNEDAVEMVLRLDPETGKVIPGRDEVRV